MGSVQSEYTKKCCKASSGDLRHLGNFKAARECFILIEVLIPCKSFKNRCNTEVYFSRLVSIPSSNILMIPLNPLHDAATEGLMA
jgi:hypothetical protein